MPTVEVNGAHIYYEEHGKGFPLVFVHGAGGNHMSWWQQVPEFSRHYRCVTYDQRGWGFSLDSDATGPAALVDDLRSLLDHLGIEQAFLIAQSMGGLACFGLTLANPERVKGIVMANTFAGMRREVWLASDEVVRQSVRDIWERRQADTVKRSLSREFSSRHKTRHSCINRWPQQHGPNPPRRLAVDRYQAGRSGAGVYAQTDHLVAAPVLHRWEHVR
jgi:pimeloyl-ACP methyl ester carboxylesterase